MNLDKRKKDRLCKILDSLLVTAVFAVPVGIFAMGMILFHQADKEASQEYQSSMTNIVGLIQNNEGKKFTVVDNVDPKVAVTRDFLGKDDNKDGEVLLLVSQGDEGTATVHTVQVPKGGSLLIRPHKHNNKDEIVWDVTMNRIDYILRSTMLFATTTHQYGCAFNDTSSTTCENGWHLTPLDKPFTKDYRL